jgi:uncharacterized membrane protein YdjX (TVP38/TMEM64 family)
VLGIAAVLPVASFFVLGELPGERWLSSRGNGIAVGMLGGLLLAVDVLLPVPSSAVGVLLGARLGVAAGFFWCLIGLLAGNLVGFGLGRAALARLDPRLPSTPTALLVLVTRPVPILAEGLTIAAGASDLSIGRFLAAALAGNLIYGLALAALGAALIPEAWVAPGVALCMAVSGVMLLLSRRRLAFGPLGK